MVGFGSTAGAVNFCQLVLCCGFGLAGRAVSGVDKRLHPL
jgi:hypothetical protein